MEKDQSKNGLDEEIKDVTLMLAGNRRKGKSDTGIGKNAKKQNRTKHTDKNENM